MRGAAGAVALMSAGVALLATPALAHDDDGIFTDVHVTAAAEPLTANVRARLVYANDGDSVPAAAPTVDAVGPAGETAAAVPLTALGDGSYEGALTFPSPGSWTVRLAATAPVAAAETPFTVEPPPTTTEPPPTSTRAPTDADEAGSGSGAGAVVAVVGILVLAAAGAGFVLARRAASP